MKKVSLSLILCLIGLNLYAQTSAVSKAETHLGKGELDKAKEQIDLAIAHEKTMNKGKTFFVKGKVYEAIFMSEDEKFKTLVENADEIAIASYIKTKELEGKNSMIKASAELQLDGFYANMINKGAEQYQEGDYKKAQYFFNVATKVSPEDTTAHLYHGFSSQQANDLKTAEKAYLKLISLDYHKSDVYGSLIYFARMEKDEEKALKIVKEARKHLPNDKTLAQEELSILIATDKLNEAKEQLLKTIDAEPSNPSHYYNLAYLYEKSNEDDKAVVAYQKAIDLNPEYFDAYFNLGVIQYNLAVEIIKEVNNMDLNTYNKLGKKKEAESLKQLEKALPYFESAHKLNDKDLATVETLSIIYTRLSKLNEAEKMKQILEANQ